jgi:hypothetical protein
LSFAGSLTNDPTATHSVTVFGSEIHVHCEPDPVVELPVVKLTLPPVVPVVPVVLVVPVVPVVKLAPVVLVEPVETCVLLILISEHPQNVSWGPQPVHDVPLASVPHRLPVQYFH